MRTPENTPTFALPGFSNYCAAMFALCSEKYSGCQDATAQRNGAKASGAHAKKILTSPPYLQGTSFSLPASLSLSLSFAILLLLALTGCAGMADATAKIAGLGVVTQENSTFDNATIVEVSPNWLYDPNGSWGNGVKLGARWTSKAPKFAALILSYSSNTSGSNAVYVGLKGIDINIDGDIKSFTSGQPTNLDSSAYNTVSKTIYTESKNAVVVPYSTLEKMVSAKDCRLRIHTSKGYEDAQFSVERIPGGQGTAILSFREFVSSISTLKAKL